MKPLLKTLLILVTLFSFTPYTATASSYPEKLGTKLGNGLSNAVTGIAEIPKTIMITNRTNGPAYAATAGFMTGLVQMLGRTGCGVIDLVTFMIPTKPIVQPGFVWQNFNKETTYTSKWEIIP